MCTGVPAYVYISRYRWVGTRPSRAVLPFDENNERRNIGGSDSMILFLDETPISAAIRRVALTRRRGVVEFSKELRRFSEREVRGSEKKERARERRTDIGGLIIQFNRRASERYSAPARGS